MASLHNQTTHMSAIIEALKNPVIQEIDRTIQELTPGKHVWNITKGQKADFITQAMAKIPIKERVNLLASEDPSVDELWTALAFAKKGNIVLWKESKL